MAQSQRSTKRQKIEPLNYMEMAQAPALKGGISLLEISPEEVRSGRFHGVGALGDGVTAGYVSTPRDVSTPGGETVSPRQKPSRRAGVTPISTRRKPDQSPTHLSSPTDETSPGDETAPAGDTAVDQRQDIAPGRGRSQVRRCVLAQDGHSLGEEAIYQVMWRSGRPESGDPNSSRTVRIGAADLGIKVNMAKKNVRQNIARLFEKLSIEILEDFDTMNSQARLYRVFSYKQILDRRRAVGLEYVLRNKGVVFCTSSGKQIVSSPAYVSTPGDETCPRPAKPKARRQPKAAPPALSQVGVGVSSPAVSDVEVVSAALNHYWPVDEPAALHLIRECRRVRPDARPEEIAFFVEEKLHLARQNRNITNPTGLVLATVPQCFVGTTFEKFRRRLEEQAAHAAEERARKKREQEALTAWVAEERERLEALVNDEQTSEKDRLAAEKELRQLVTWYPAEVTEA